MNMRDNLLALALEPANSGYPDIVDAGAVVAQLGAEVARALSSALERVNTLAATGRIDREDLRGLREEIELARRIGIMGQQLVRLSNGDVSLSSERVELTSVLREALQLRQREARTRNIEVRHSFVDVAMNNDATLTFSLVETLLEWVFEHARQRIVFRLEAKQNPTRARLTCAFLRRAVDGVPTLYPDGHRDPALSTLSWRLLKQMAHVMGLQLRRRDTGDRCEMRLTFPGADATHSAALPGLEAEDLSGMPVYQVPPLEGRHVVVLAARRDVRHAVRDALKPSGAMLDFVSTIEEAQRLFEDALPHAVIHEAGLGGDKLVQMRLALLLEAPHLAFIEIAHEGRSCEVHEAEGHAYSRVGRDGLAENLPTALLFELSRHG